MPSVDPTAAINQAQHPQRVAQIQKQWHDMTGNVLHAPEKAKMPVLETATGAMHPEYSDFAKPFNTAGPEKTRGWKK